MTLEPGEMFAGYTIVALIGAGGMGEVYLAEHPRLPRRDALKILSNAISADRVFQDRFIREADLAARLWHPNLVAVHDRGEADGRLWIAMDYVEGLDAGELLAERYPAGMPVNDAVAIITAVADALDYAHKQGLIHRDVKPSNILLTHPDDDGRRRILLSDFGIARTAGEVSGLTATNMTVGTVSYSAPEQLLGLDVNGRADQYALAATAYQLLTGAHLFSDSNPAVVIGRHLSLEPPSPSLMRPELAPFDAPFARALAKSPDDRFPRCQDFARALAEASNDIVGAAVNVSPSTATQPAPLPSAELAAAAAQTQSAQISQGDYALAAAETQLAPVPAPPANGDRNRLSGRAPWLLAALATFAIVGLVIGAIFALRPSGSSGTRPTVSIGSDSPTATASPPPAIALPPAIANSGTLRVGTNVPYAPSEFLDSQHRVVGSDIDLMNAIAQEVGLTTQLEEFDFARLIPAVQQNQIDVAISAFTDTREREAVADFIDYYSAGTQWAQLAGRPGPLIDPDNACGLTVAVQATTTQETDELPARNKKCEEAGKPSINILKFEGQDAATNAVILGQADAISADSTVTEYGVKISNGRLITAGPIMDAAPQGFVVAKGSALGPALQQALQRLIDSGKYTQILDRWGLGQGAVTTARMNGAVY